MDPAEFFRSPTEPMQVRYEAMRAFFLENWTAEQVATHFGLSPYTVYTLSRDFKQGTLPPFFAELRKGPKSPVKLNEPAKERMIALRKQNLSIEEIAESLKREEFEDFSEKTIRDVLKKEGFTRLFRRTRAERRIYLQASREPTEMADVHLFGVHSRVSTLYGGAFLFLPMIA
jgi:transposase